jgi:hypothetical protein
MRIKETYEVKRMVVELPYTIKLNEKFLILTRSAQNAIIH